MQNSVGTDDCSCHVNQVQQVCDAAHLCAVIDAALASVPLARRGRPPCDGFPDHHVQGRGCNPAPARDAAKPSVIWAEKQCPPWRNGASPLTFALQARAPVLLSCGRHCVQDARHALPCRGAGEDHECPVDGPQLSLQVCLIVAQRVGLLVGYRVPFVDNNHARPPLRRYQLRQPAATVRARADHPRRSSQRICSNGKTC